MGNNGPVVPKEVPLNERRGICKKKRGKGLLAIGEGDRVAWGQSQDPLFKVKGMERHRRVKGIF